MKRLITIAILSVVLGGTAFAAVGGGCPTPKTGPDPVFEAVIMAIATLL